jgi:hypothetical protein
MTRPSAWIGVWTSHVSASAGGADARAISETAEIPAVTLAVVKLVASATRSRPTPRLASSTARPAPTSAA